MTKINSLDDIVKNGLCIGCGLCKSIAGNSLQMEMSDKGNLEPKELTPITNETLEEIKKVCPGVIAEGPENHEENEGYHLSMPLQLMLKEDVHERRTLHLDDLNE